MDPYLAITVLGKDRPGLIADVSGNVTELGGNIVHVEQQSIYGLFSMLMLIELAPPKAAPPRGDAVSARMNRATATLRRDIYQFTYELARRVRALGMDVNAEIVDAAAARPHAPKDLRVITILGSDKVGVMHAITSSIAKHGINIERMHHVARGDFMAFEITIDGTGHNLGALRTELREVCEGIGVDAVIQPDSMFRARKRLVVFDMDSTIIEGEVVNELARVAGVEAEVARLTERAMKGELDFPASLRERVRMLRGLPLASLEEIARGLKLTPGTEDLITALKAMGFRIALISGGFTFFTDHLKNELGFDYTYANDLVIRDGLVTGEVREPILDSERKAEIVRELAKKEGLRMEEVVAIGDGANDRIMVKNAGLGIAFNAKDVLKQVAHGSISKDNLRGLLFCLGATDVDMQNVERELQKRRAGPAS
ncbi:MAG: phosphoserine phosphatase SerB [Methanobacteriota archaeon]